MDTFYRNVSRRLKFSITFKMTVIYSLIFSFLVFTLSSCIIVGFALFLGQSAYSGMEKQKSFIDVCISNKVPLTEEVFKDIENLYGVKITVMNKNSKIIYGSSEQEDIFQTAPEKRVYFKKVDNFYWMVVKERIESNGEQDTILIVNPLTHEYDYLTALSVILFLVNLIVIITALIVGSKASRRLMRPVEKMTQTVKAITIQDMGKRLDISGSHDELKELAETFNEMINRIQQAYDQQNQFVSDASHELRTPIAVIQGYANMLDRWGKKEPAVLEESIGAIKEESENMKELVEKLLFLARGDKNQQQVNPEKFNLDELIGEVVRETKLIDKNHHIHNLTCESICIEADRKLIKEALRIFIDNSIKYTPSEGSIKVMAYKKGKEAVVDIEDTGIGISKEDLPYIFDRFYRADKSRTKQSGGTGLGLAIAKWIIMRHKGTIQIQSKEGTGTKISVFLPLLDNVSS